MKRHSLFKFSLIKFFVPILFLFSCKEKAKEITTDLEVQKGLLWEYVHSDDTFFDYEVIHTLEEEEYSYHVVKMVSQHWLTQDIVNETEWWHWVSIVVPKETQFETGLMWIGGGSKGTKLPEVPQSLILEAAMRTGSIVAEVHNIPFQPLVFENDTFGERYEDAIISYGWRKFLEGGAKDEDAYWLARLPMTKAVKLAMDVVAEVANEKHGVPVEKFMVAGASKRGWTTWTTAAVDDRVVAIAPVVIDLLNLVPSFQHHWRNYGFWAPAVDDYVREGIMDWQGSREYQRLLEITEPFSFIEDLDMPKLLINATGDQFFLPDSWKFYWDELKGEKHLQYVPNFGHDLSDSDALPNLISFYASILNQKSRPKYNWEISEDIIYLALEPNEKPASIKLWTAHNDEARDFRVDVFGENWTSSEILVNESGRYEIQLDTPEKGYTAYFVELTFQGEIPLKVTSGVEVLPRTYPFAPFESASPKGTH
jgi:PhoPQ-activated pathogenicity-related protein